MIAIVLSMYYNKIFLIVDVSFQLSCGTDSSQRVCGNVTNNGERVFHFLSSETFGLSIFVFPLPQTLISCTVAVCTALVN